MNDLTLFGPVEDDAVKSAVISDCGTYRYRLSRSWAAGPRMLFVMLNPSTADASIDDPTIRRCIGFAKRQGCGFLQVVNLFAYRATDPDALLNCPVDPVGPENYRHIKAATEEATYVVAAWGAHKSATPAAVSILPPRASLIALCLGRTKSGAPRHPLYVRGDAPLISWQTLASHE